MRNPVNQANSPLGGKTLDLILAELYLRSTFGRHKLSAI